MIKELYPLSPLSLEFRRRGGGSFDIASTNPSAYYDRTNLATLFQDSTGVTPVTAGAQPIGLGLDQSQGLALGPELIVNAADRDFSSNTGFWGNEGNATISGGKCNVNNAGGTAPIYKFNFPNEPGGYYEIAFDVDLSAGNLELLFADINIPIPVTNGRVVIRGYRGGIGTFGLRNRGVTTSIGTIDNISIKRVAGNHQLQATAGKRPIADGTPIYANFDAVDDDLVATFPASLGAGCTVCRSLPGTGASITTGVTIGTTYTDNVDAHALLIYTAAQWAALDAWQIANITTWLNGRAGL